MPLLLSLTAVFAVLLVISSIKLIGKQSEYKEGNNIYTELSSAVVLRPNAKAPPDQQEDEADSPPAVAEPPPGAQSITIDFPTLQAINADSVGWLISADGGIDYPLAQGTDNDYYLNHLIDGTENSSGSLFVDFRNAADFTDRNTFIYGHNMRNGSMFGRLEEMGAAQLELITPAGRYRLTGFAGYVTPGNSDIYRIQYADDADFEQYLQHIRLMSEFTSSIDVTAEDRIVTLSTCAYGYDDARYVLHCKIEPDTETMENGGDHE